MNQVSLPILIVFSFSLRLKDASHDFPFGRRQLVLSTHEKPANSSMTGIENSQMNTQISYTASLNPQTSSHRAIDQNRCKQEKRSKQSSNERERENKEREREREMPVIQRGVSQWRLSSINPRLFQRLSSPVFASLVERRIKSRLLQLQSWLMLPSIKLISIKTTN